MVARLARLALKTSAVLADRGTALAALLALAVPAAAQFGTGFEAPDYVVGAIDNQQGWNVQVDDIAVAIMAIASARSSSKAMA